METNTPFVASAAHHYDKSPSHGPSLSVVEQGMLDRQLFDLLRSNMDIVEEPVHFSTDDAKDFLASVTPKLERHYSWLEQANPQTIARLLGEVIDLRNTYASKYNELPEDAYFYRAYRMRETAQPDDKFASEAVIILDALMNGDVTSKTRLFSNTLQ